MHAFPRRTVSIAAAGALGVALLTGTVFGADHPSPNDWPYASAGPAPVLAAVGDVACEPDDPENSANPASLKCGSPSLGGLAAQYATADAVEKMHPDLVALLGDEQYEVGKLSDFEASFDKTYGAFKFLERPAPGNHEYYPYTKHGDNEPGQNGAGYFSYFNGTDANGNVRPQGQAGDYNQGWYSYNLGDWHIISLNAECASPAFGNSCDPTTGSSGKKPSGWRRISRPITAPARSPTGISPPSARPAAREQRRTRPLPRRRAALRMPGGSCFTRTVQMWC